MNAPLDVDSPVVSAHLNSLQAVIQRMAGNCAACKTWCVTVVAGILVFMGDKEKPAFAYVAGLSAVLFFGLDVYYLALEAAFRSSYDSFVRRLHAGTLESREAFVIAPAAVGLEDLGRSCRSPSVWPFYLVLLGMIGLARQFAIPTATPEPLPRHSVSAGRTAVVTTTITTMVSGEDEPAVPSIGTAIQTAPVAVDPDGNLGAPPPTDSPAVQAETRGAAASGAPVPVAAPE